MKKGIVGIVFIVGLSFCGCGMKEMESEGMTQGVAYDDQQETVLVNEEVEETIEETIEETYEIHIDQLISLVGVTSDCSLFSLEEIEGTKAILSVEELSERIQSVNGINGDEKADISFESLDCGGDGTEEVLLKISFSSIGYTVLCVMKQEGDLYEMKYIIDQLQLDDVSIDANGRIMKSVAEKANVRNYKYSHLDQEYQYVFDYGYRYYLAARYFEKIDASGEEWDDIQIFEYYFSENEETADKYYFYKEFDISEESNQIMEKDNIYYQKFIDENLHICTEDEITDMIEQLN